MNFSKDTPSRVDFQITTDCITMAELWDLVENDYAVSKLRKNNPHFDGLGSKKELESFTLGTRKSPVRFCFYNKFIEMNSGGNFGTQKYMLLLEKMGAEWVNSPRPATRIEISVKRDALKCMGINSVDELFENEWAIINLLTQDWFRILEEPKIDKQEKRQKNHPVWDRIRSLFRLYFPGGNDDDVAEWESPKPIAGNAERKKRMALGCISAAFGEENGEQPDVRKTKALAYEWVDSVLEELHYKLNKTAKRTEGKSGIPLGAIPLDHNMEHMHTLDQDFIDRKRAEANTWLGASSDGNVNQSQEPPLVRGNGEGLDLVGATGRERMEDFMEKAKPYWVRFKE